MIVAFIPARGASKRLPRKNILSFAGRPLIYYSIALAKSVPEINYCFVSTEDQEIARIAKSYGADVVDRPYELSDDRATTVSVSRHLLEFIGTKGIRPHALLTLQPNCPLRPVSLVRQALSLFMSQKPDSVISVTKSRYKMGKIENGLFVPDYTPGARSQDMGAQYFENGLVYVTDPQVVLKKDSLFGDEILPLEIDPLYAFGDIDTELDFKVAEFLYARFRTDFDYKEIPMREVNE